MMNPKPEVCTSTAPFQSYQNIFKEYTPQEEIFDKGVYENKVKIARVSKMKTAQLQSSSLNQVKNKEKEEAPTMSLVTYTKMYQSQKPVRSISLLCCVLLITVNTTTKKEDGFDFERLF